MTATFTILDQISIASPCSADWKAMQGDDRSRLCGSCQKHVYDIASMAADEALALIHEREGHVCLRLFRRADGTVMTADCPVGARAILRRTRQLIAASSLAVVMLAGGLILPNVLGARSSSGRFRSSPVVQKAMALWDDTLVYMGLRTRFATMGDVCSPTPLPNPAPDSEQTSP